MAEQAGEKELQAQAAQVHAAEESSPPSFQILIGSSVLVRLLVDTGTQLFNPFLPIFAAGLNSNVVVLGRLVGLRSGVGLVAPLFGALADRRGYRPVLRAGLLMGAAGALLVGSSTSVLMAAVGMMVWGLGVAAFVPTLQAYISAQLPYRLRARGIGVLEYAWALAGIVGLFSIGFLIDAAGWRAPFFVLGCGMGVASIAYGLMPRADRIHEPSAGSGSRAAAPDAIERSWWGFFRLGANARSAYAAIVGGSLYFTGAMQIMIAHSVWLTREYGLGAAQLGTVALALGLADLCGSGLVSIFTDRLGKRRSVLLGCAGALSGYVLMPFLNVGVLLAIGSIAVARGCFEFAVVSQIPLLSEQVPAQRGKVMTLGAAFNLLGVTVAGATGPWLYTKYGVPGLSGTSFVLTATAMLVIWVYVREDAHVA